MKQLLTSITFLVFLFLTGCSNKESAESIGKKWCELNARVHTAKTDTEREKAEEAREKFEDEMEKKYEKDEDFLEKAKKASIECDTYGDK